QEQLQEWADQQSHCTEQIAKAEADLEAAAARTEEARVRIEDAQAEMPELDARLRSQADAREEMRRVLARIEQDLALVGQAQQDADRQLQALELRQERLQDELRAVDAPDPAEIERLAGDSVAMEAQLHEAQAQLMEFEDRLPELDEQRRAAHGAAQEESQAVARLDARLSALSKLQEDVQKQGALEPWLARHELTSLSRLWQKLHIQSGWETALEAVLRERIAGI